MRRDELIGRTVAHRFRIKRVLGEGGMATVFVAEQDAEPREVALKILRADLHADRTFAKRFEREAKAAARVQHVNSVTIFDAGVEGNLSYIAMELLRGDDLFTLLERHGALAPRTAATIVAEVCDALTVAHGLGIVHRDLKPENIMIVRDPSTGGGAQVGAPKSVPLPAGARVKVLDFGIAKLLDKTPEAPRAGGNRLDPPSQLTAVTMHGTLIGTPAYMSPEQCAQLPIDARSDIYTCGVLLYQMITGRLPFDGPTPLHVATKHIHEDPPSLAALIPNVDPALEVLVQKTLAKRPMDRPPSARNLGGALRKLIPLLPDAPYGSVARVGDTTDVELPNDSQSIEVSVRSGPGSDVIASAKTMVAEGVGGPPPSVLLHAPEAPRRPLAILARHPSSGEKPAEEAAPEPPRKPLAILARHPPVSAEPPVTGGARSTPTPPAPGVEAEPEDLASTLIRGTPGESAAEDLARARNANEASARAASAAHAERQVTMQSAVAPTSGARAAAPEPAARISVVTPPPPPPPPPPPAPAAPLQIAVPIKPAPPMIAAAPPAPAAQPSGGATVHVHARTPIPVMPTASVILSPSLVAPPQAQAPVPVPVSPVPASMPSSMGGAQSMQVAPAPTFGLPQVPVATPVAAAPVVGRVLWVGILIGTLVSALVFALAYLFFMR